MPALMSGPNVCFASYLNGFALDDSQPRLGATSSSQYGAPAKYQQQS
jgi:hypothetical protein